MATEDEPWRGNAMTLATVDASGRPSARIVLMRGYDESGVRFFTNYDSRKGDELSQNPRAALVFWWPSQVRQVRFEGIVAKASSEVSDAYFASRSRNSQLGAHASRQSQSLESFDQLVSQFDEIQNRYDGEVVPRPSNWGGYVLSPIRIEFWQGGEHRLHDRFEYVHSEKRQDSWKIRRLSP